MSKKNGRFIVLRDIQDHAIKGDLSLFDLGVYSVIHFQTEFSSGVWFGSAARVHATAPQGTSLRDVQRSMEHLEELRFLRSFRKHGQRGNAPHLVHKYEPLTGALRGKRLNAFSSGDWRHPVYESCALPDTETDALPDAQADTYSESSTHQAATSRKKNRAADARFGPFLEFAKGSFETRHGHPPTWDCFGKDGSALSAFLRRAPHVTLEIWQVHVLNFFDSTEAFTVKQGGSLSYFLSKFDAFEHGPILEGGSNGKLVSFAEQRSQKNADAIQRVLGCAEEASGDIRRALPPAHN